MRPSLLGLVLVVAIASPVAASGRSGGAVASAMPPNASTCGRLQGPVLELAEDSIDAVPKDGFDVGGRHYQSADFDLTTLSVLELAWIADTAVCIAETSDGTPVGANASIDACGDVLVGATTWLFRIGSGELDANGHPAERTGFIHDTIMGFATLGFGGDPEPPNFYSALRIAVDANNPDDCLVATLAWTAPAAPVVDVAFSTSECLIARSVDSRVATFAHTIESNQYTFTMTPGSSVAPVFEPDELGGVGVTTRRGLNGLVTIAAVQIPGCPDANAVAGQPVKTTPPSDRPATPTTSPSATAVEPSIAPSESPSASPVVPSSSPSPSAASAAAVAPSLAPPSTVADAVGQLDSGPGGPTDRDESSGATILALLAAALVVAGGVAIAFLLFGPRRRARARHGRPGTGSAGRSDAPRASSVLSLDSIGLTRREHEVLEMVAGGLTNREIGTALFITESTAGVHVSNILGKLGVDSRTEAARYALEAGVRPTNPIGPVH